MRSRQHETKCSAVVAGTIAAIVCVLATAASSASKSPPRYDVAVYGATPGGVAAAVAAAREGKLVVLVEPLPLVGGMKSGGMGMSDSFLMHRETLGGLYREFRRRIAEDYRRRGVQLPYEVDFKQNGVTWTAEPHVHERVFEAMLREAGVRVLLGERLEHAERNDTSIAALHTHSGKMISAKVFIDASYEGDLLAAAKVGYRVGREGRDEFGESLAGARYIREPIIDVHGVSNVSAVDEEGKPLPLITGTERTAEGQGDHRLMTYSFRLCLTDEPANRVPFAEPADYDPARFELFRRVYKVFPEYGRWGLNESWVEESLPFHLFPIPGNKFDANNLGGRLSLGLVGASWDYPEADHAQRQAIWNAHRSYTEGLLYFLTSDPAVPEPVRRRANELGYCKDEFVRFGHFPPVLYVREGRRMVGEYVMRQADVLEHREKPDPIGIGSFLIDSHTVQRILTDKGGFIDEGMIGGPTIDLGLRWQKAGGSEPIPVPFGKPYQIPYRSIVPKAAECTNLLVPVALSATHVAFASLRIEPTWMILGESAGIAAALAVEQGVPVQKVDRSSLMKRLQAKGQILHVPGSGRETSERQ